MTAHEPARPYFRSCSHSVNEGTNRQSLAEVTDIRAGEDEGAQDETQVAVKLQAQINSPNTGKCADDRLWDGRDMVKQRRHGDRLVDVGVSTFGAEQCVEKKQRFWEF